MLSQLRVEVILFQLVLLNCERNFGVSSSPVSTSELIGRVMEEHGVVPDVLDKAPAAPLSVKFDKVQADFGNILTPTQVQHEPIVSWSCDPKKYYVLCMTDPDAPSRKEPKFREWHHWLVGNIPGNEISKGTVLSEVK